MDNSIIVCKVITSFIPSNGTVIALAYDTLLLFPVMFNVTVPLLMVNDELCEVVFMSADNWKLGSVTMAFIDSISIKFSPGPKI